MRHLIIGAGATFAEALAIGIPREQCPPLIRDFARKTWFNYTPHPVLEAYLRQLGHVDLGRDPRELFYRLEEEGLTNIELFMEYAWVNRHHEMKIEGKNPPPGYISGFRLTSADNLSSVAKPVAESSEFWSNLLYHGIGNPMSFFMSQCFFENGKGWKDLALSRSMARHLLPTDLVLSLNYDTVFEISLEQQGLAFCYSPNRPNPDQILIAKPHGSLNMVMDAEGFTFGQPEWLGMPQPPGYQSYSGLIPPRLNKSYTQHPASTMILAPVHDRKPNSIIMWGVGLTDSDVDLIALYQHWAQSADTLDVINPCADVAENAGRLLQCRVRHFQSFAEWELAM